MWETLQQTTYTLLCRCFTRDVYIARCCKDLVQLALALVARFLVFVTDSLAVAFFFLPQSQSLAIPSHESLFAAATQSPQPSSPVSPQPGDGAVAQLVDLTHVGLFSPCDAGLSPAAADVARKLPHARGDGAGRRQRGAADSLSGGGVRAAGEGGAGAGGAAAGAAAAEPCGGIGVDRERAVGDEQLSHDQQALWVCGVAMKRSADRALVLRRPRALRVRELR